MADNVEVDNGALTDYDIATDKVTYSGDADVDVQLVRPVLVTGSEGSKTVVDLPGDNTNGLDVDVTRVGGNVAVLGSVAHDAADSGAPIKVGGIATTTNPAAVADSDRVNAIFDDVGRQVVILNKPRDLVVQQATTISNTTETTILTAGASGVFHDITGFIISNTGNQATRVDIRDATAGTVRFSIFLAPGGGGAVIFPPVPIKQTTAANNWTAEVLTTVSDIRIFVQAIANV